MSDLFSSKITEALNSQSKDIDTRNISEILEIFFSEDEKIIPAIRKEASVIQQVIEKVVEVFQQEGHLFYVGAGTSGRLGNLDAVECPPTFSTPPKQVQSILAGGDKALKQAIEGAEDNREEGANQATAYISAKDIVIGIAASGSTPFVLGFLEKAHHIGAITVLLTFNPISIPEYLDYCIAPQVGPEIISGSTRLKAGTGTKLVLNLISTISMIRIGKVYSHFMIDLNPSCEKLRKRSLRILANLTGLEPNATADLLESANGKIKQAMIMHQKNLSFTEASLLLEQNSNNLRKALKSPERP